MYLKIASHHQLEKGKIQDKYKSPAEDLEIMDEKKQGQFGKDLGQLKRIS